MLRTVRAEIDSQGVVRLLEPVEIAGPRMALVTILDEGPPVHGDALALLGETAMARDRDRPEEDEAWAYLPSE